VNVASTQLIRAAQDRCDRLRHLAPRPPKAVMVRRLSDSLHP
jgi:hypothetical protein